VIHARKVIAALPLRRVAAALTFFVGLVVAAPGEAQTPDFDFGAREEPVEIRADSIEYRYPDDVYVAEGNVRVVQGNRTLTSNWATFSGRTRIGAASGDVVYRDGRDLLTARFAQFGVDSLEGVVLGANLDLGERGLRVAAEELVRTGQDRYHLLNARFTACRCPDPDERRPWEMVAATSDVELGGYGTSRNTTVEVLGVPVVWLPWIMYPVKTERQTGLLMPEFSLGGRNGFTAGLPVFWAPLRNLNVMATPHFSARRGFKQDLGVETVYGARSRTRLRGAFAHEDSKRHAPVPAVRDVVEDPARTPAQSVNGNSIRDRGFVALEHDQDLPGGVRLKADAAWMTDNEYVLDHTDLASHKRDRFLQSVAFATRSFGEDKRFGVQVASWFADDLQSREGLDRDEFLLQRFADVEAQWLTGSMEGLAGLTAGFDVDYQYFGRRKDPSDVMVFGSTNLTADRFYDVGIDATTRSSVSTASGPVAIPGYLSGVFEEGEPLADRGHRLTLYPRLGRPARFFDVLETFTEAGYRQTLYWTERQGFEKRGQITGRSEVAMRLSREFASPGQTPRRHELVPKLEWAFVDSERGQSTNPLFTPRTKAEQFRLRQRQLDSLALDPADEVRTTNRVSLRFDNRLYRGRGRSERLAGEFGFGFDYDIHGSNVGHIVAEGRRIRVGPGRARFQLAYEAGKQRLDEGYAEIAMPLFGKARTVVRYRYIRHAPEFFELFNSDLFDDGRARRYDEVSQISASLTVPLLDRFVLNYRMNYSFAGSEFLTNSASLDYISRCDCWALGVQVNSSRNEQVSYRLRYSILGFGDNIRNPFERSW